MLLVFSLYVIGAVFCASFKNVFIYLFVCSFICSFICLFIYSVCSFFALFRFDFFVIGSALIASIVEVVIGACKLLSFSLH